MDEYTPGTTQALRRTLPCKSYADCVQIGHNQKKIESISAIMTKTAEITAQRRKKRRSSANLSSIASWRQRTV